jgi:phosphatidylserine/phosphatidylglycerophosphate/cardiolipin synthase-like enzyme
LRERIFVRLYLHAGKFILSALGASVLLTAPATASDVTVTIKGSDAVFLAGRTDLVIPPASDPWPGGLIRHASPTPEEIQETLPPFVPVSGGDIIRATGPAVGGVSFFNGFGGIVFSPSGNGLSGSNLSSFGGISGYIGPQGALTGVFLDDSIPAAGPPPTLDFSPAGLGIDFTTLSPALGQVFYIGDGITGGGDFQQFVAPAGATRLFLGIPDGFGFTGAPGAYDDNDGSYQISIGATKLTCDEFTTAIPLSPIAQAVQAVVNEQFYCQNSFDELIIIPDPPAPFLGSGKRAFEKFAALARTAQLEVDFVNMIWQDEKFPSDDTGSGDNGPMVIALQGIRDLYERVKADPAGYPQGVHVRILAGFQYSLLSDPRDLGRGKDQRVSILRALERLGVPREDVGWHLEVGAYRKSSETDQVPRMGTHSHVKMLIVDGRSAIVAGYNMEYEYLSRGDSPSGGALQPKHDFGVAVSGPIVQSSLGVFRELWRDARVCRAFVDLDCTQEDTASAIGLSFPQLPVGGTPASVFSLFRNDEPWQKQSDQAIVAAIRAAQTNINIVQARYFENVWIPLPYSPSCARRGISASRLCDDSGPMDYTLAVVAAIEKGVKVRLLLPLAKREDRLYNLPGALNLILQAGRHASNLEIGFFGSGRSRPPIHGKALSIDGQFLIVGSQNWDHSAFGDLENLGYGSFDLAEYNLGIDSATAATQFDDHFEKMWANTTAFWPPRSRAGR